MIRIDAIWLATEPMDMRAGTETALARVVAVFGAAQPHCAYLFANRRATRMKVLVHDGIGVWLAARRLNQGKFHWAGVRQGSEVQLDNPLTARWANLPRHLAWRSENKLAPHNRNREPFLAAMRLAMKRQPPYCSACAQLASASSPPYKIPVQK